MPTSWAPRNLEARVGVDEVELRGRGERTVSPLRPNLQELASCAFVKKGQDVVLAGPIGTGKTHLAIALDVCAARKRHRVLMRPAAKLVRPRVHTRGDRTIGDRTRITRGSRCSSSTILASRRLPATRATGSSAC